VHNVHLVQFHVIPVGKSFPRLVQEKPYFDSRLLQRTPSILSLDLVARSPGRFIPLHLFNDKVIAAFKQLNPPVAEELWLKTLPPKFNSEWDDLNAYLTVNGSNGPQHPFFPAAYLRIDELEHALINFYLYRAAPMELFVDSVSAGFQLMQHCRSLADHKEAVQQFELNRFSHHSMPENLGPWIANYEEINLFSSTTRIMALNGAASAAAQYRILREQMRSTPIARSAASSNYTQSDLPFGSAPTDYCHMYWNGKPCVNCRNSAGFCRFKWARASEAAQIPNVNHNKSYQSAADKSSNKQRSGNSGSNRKDRSRNSPSASTSASSSLAPASSSQASSDVKREE
jgi:hypothetical protein